MKRQLVFAYENRSRFKRMNRLVQSSSNIIIIIQNRKQFILYYTRDFFIKFLP